jgi:ferritin-like protein
MKEVDFGSNKTPSKRHSKMTKQMVDGYDEFPPSPEDTRVEATELRTDYICSSPTFGSVPLPPTLSGALKMGVQTIAGHDSAKLIDKLGERLAFERTGVRLYEAFITKGKSFGTELDFSVAWQYREEEAKHFALVRDCIEEMGGDPTAQTPCANAMAVAGMGLMQLLNDPRSTVAQSLEAILTAELTDCAGWDLLIELTAESKMSKWVERFQEAKKEEDVHLVTVKQWLRSLTLAKVS